MCGKNRGLFLKIISLIFDPDTFSLDFKNSSFVKILRNIIDACWFLISCNFLREPAKIESFQAKHKKVIIVRVCVLTIMKVS